MVPTGFSKATKSASLKIQGWAKHRVPIALSMGTRCPLSILRLISTELACRHRSLRFPGGQFAIGFALEANGDGLFAIGAKLAFDRFFHG